MRVDVYSRTYGLGKQTRGCDHQLQVMPCQALWGRLISPITEATASPRFFCFGLGECFPPLPYLNLAVSLPG